MTKDYYDVLGVGKGSSKDEIKKAYKQLAKKFHPDISKEKDAEARFKEISEAYAVLSDDKKKQQYDTFGSAEFGQKYSKEDIFKGFDFSEFEDMFGGSVFDMFFGGGGRRRRQSRGNDLQFSMTIDFEEAVFGIKKDITLKKLAKCKACDGTGAENKDLISCPNCNGQGQVRSVQRTMFGAFQTVSACRACGGQGQTPKHDCNTCGGEGVVEERVEVSINIPAGVDDGSRLRVPGEGEAGTRGSRAGDLYIDVSVRPSDIFKREGNDLYLDLPITFSQAALGDEIKIPTLEKEVKIKIKAATQSGTHYKLSGKGVPSVNGYGRGDLYVIANIITPKKLSKDQKALFTKLKKTEEKKSILDRIKEFAK